MKQIRINNLDYLRAFAIIFVIASHIPFINVKSGAVNIFFVLTGYLITKSLNNKYRNQTIIKFYSDRLTKLIPKIALVGLFVYLLWENIFLNYNKTILLKSYLSSTLGYYNLYLIDLNESYNNQKVLNPYLPLWAFSLIIQFYIIAPFVIKGFNKVVKLTSIKQNHVWKIYLAITIGLLSWNIFSKDLDINKFYGSTYRLWEFFVGVLAYYISELKMSELIKRDVFIIGIVGILVWTTIPNSYISDQENIISVVLVTGLFIVGSSAVKIRELKLLTNIGKTSFDSYIVHYPLLFLFSVLGYTHIFNLFIYSALLIIFSYTLYKIFKFEVIQKNIVLITVATIIIFLFSLFLSSRGSNIENEITANNKFGDSAQAMFEKTIGKDGHPCLDNVRWDLNCSFTTLNPVGSIFLIGTSQAEVFSESLLNFARENKYDFYDITKGGCPFLLEFDQIEISYDQIRKGCGDVYNRNILKKISETPNSIVIYHTRMQYYLHNLTEFRNFGDGSMPSSEVPWKYVGANNSTKQLTLDNWRVSLQQIPLNADKFILVYPIPEFDSNFVPEKIDLNDSSIKSLDYKYYKLRTQSSFDVFDKIVGDNIIRIYPDQLLCNEGIQGKCVGNSPEKIYYTDESHLSKGGVELIYPQILGSLQSLQPIQ